MTNTDALIVLTVNLSFPLLVFLNSFFILGFGSVGEDSKLCFWDFNVSSLYVTKKYQSSAATLRRSKLELDMDVEHPLLNKSEVPVISPVLCVSVHSEPLCSVTFKEEEVVTTDRHGIIKIWNRPS